MSAERPSPAVWDAVSAESGIGARAGAVVSLASLVLVVLWLAPGLVFSVGVAAVSVAATRELYLLRGVSGSRPLFRAIGLAGAAAIGLEMLILPAAALAVAVPMAAVAVLSAIVVTTREPRREELEEVLFVLFGMLYVPVLLGQLMLIRRLQSGRELVTALVVVVLAREAGAHLGGRIFRTARPINKSINAKKSVAGAAVGVVVACAATVVLSRQLEIGFTVPRALVFGACAGIACQFGDLVESYVKRVAGRRHSGTLLGPEGGVLDFVDAAAFASATAHLLLLWWGYSQS
jgi:phosphatidate cytidylyltransferase